MIRPAAPLARLRPLASGVRARWSAFAPREQMLIMLFLVIALLGGFYYTAVRPLQAMRAEARDDIARYGALAGRLSALDFAAMDAAGAAEQRSGTPADIAMAAAADHDLVVDRRTESGDGIRILLNTVPYAQLIAWLADVERTSSLRVSRMQVEATAVAGQVRADVVLAQ